MLKLIYYFKLLYKLIDGFCYYKIYNNIKDVGGKINLKLSKQTHSSSIEVEI